MERSSSNQQLQDMFQLLEPCIPNDHSKQVSAEHYVEWVFRHAPGVRRVMDLGCGIGNSYDYFRMKDPTIMWIGLDKEDSPEVSSRTRTDAQFRSFDGVHIPFEDDSFDLVFCQQVFEHVRHPLPLLKEVNRILKPGGYFIGSTSHLEPYHSYSVWNYTPYGFRCLVEEAGFDFKEVRPGIDALTLILRRGLRCPEFFGIWRKRESPLNFVITLVGRLARRPHVWINGVKLLFCGQFSFLAYKNRPASTSMR